MTLPPGIHIIGDDAGGHVRCYLIEHGDKLILIDTGADAEAGLIRDKLLEIKRSPRDISDILLSHGHNSHVKGLAAIQRMSQARVWAAEWEIPIIEGKRKAERGKFPTPWQKPRNATVLKLKLGLFLQFGEHTPVQVNERLRDGDRIGPITVVHTPGHTPGHCAFFHLELGVLFGGDIINTWPPPYVGEWEGFTLDRGDNQRSINKLSDLSGVEILCPGHGDPLEGAQDVIRGLVR